IAIFHAGIIRHTAVIPLGGEIITEDIKEGCSIIKKHAEELKLKFGSALARENREEEIVAIPGLRGRPPKEISLRNLASIIQARMEEIIEHVYYEIRNSGYEKKLFGGIVLTGGGAQLKHVGQLTEFLTGMDTRIGYPNEHLASDGLPEMGSPMYATGVGLVIEGIDRYQREMDKIKPPEVTEPEEPEEESKKKKTRGKKPKDPSRSSKRFPDIFLDKIRHIFEDDVE
ncbi:MAG: cell division protein FtsA, partial [Alphaproteobacteria bacterium]|nr:cell division protein FtsA [Alphaproteobacteria bacterium]